MKYYYAFLAALMIVFGSWGISSAGTNANTWHNLPASNPANDGNDCSGDASPLDGNCASAQIHDVHAVDAAGYRQANGEPPACEFHGGFQGEKRNC